MNKLIVVGIGPGDYENMTVRADRALQNCDVIIGYMENSYRFFQNRDCKYFPCHKVKDESEFNCLFCYCPLYTLGDQCGGNCSYTDKGIKNCTSCTLPHNPKGYDYILAKFSALAELAKANRKESE